MNIYKKTLTLALVALFSLTTVPSGFALAHDNENTYGNDEIEASHVFEDGTHTIQGEIMLPNPCYEMELQVLVAESLPEQVTLQFDVHEKDFDSDVVCAQVVVEEDFEVEVEAHEDATFSATVNGEEVELDLEDIDDDDDDSDDQDDEDDDNDEDDEDEDDSDEDEDEDDDDSDNDGDEDDDSDNDGSDDSDDDDSDQSLWDRVLALLEMVKQLQNRLAQMIGGQGEVRPDLNQTTRLTRQLVRGMSGDDVRRLQELLATDPEIYPERLTTGFYGPLTEQAVKRFQAKAKISATGAVGPQTLSRINEILEEGVGPEGKIPQGLLRVPGIQSLLGNSTTTDSDESRGPRSHIQGQFDQDQGDSDSDDDQDESEPSDPPADEDIRGCTLEAKVCPDGSAVGRTGPNCQFAKCPGE
jgi:hypothetical protein